MTKRLVTGRVVRGQPTDQHARSAVRHACRRPSAGDIAAGGLNRWGLFAVYFTTFANFLSRQGMRGAILPLYGAMVLGLSPSELGSILTVSAVLTILINLPSGRLADRVGKKSLLLPGLLVGAAASLLLIPSRTALPRAASG